jgi:catechol 2,3-dioxygenase-like lactoylglutathione lyase family enzyme
MPLERIEHFLVAADDIDATRDWYARVLGLTPGPHPDFGFPVHWMYIGDADVVHIGPSAKAATDAQRAYLGRTSQAGASGTGAIDHIAFHASGLREIVSRLKAEGIAYTQRRANGQAVVQVFFHDPNGIKIELNFPAAEAADLEGDLLVATR